MKKLLHFLKNHFSFFSNKYTLSNLAVRQQFENYYFLVKETKRYSKLLDVFFKIKNGDILEENYEKQLLNSLTYQVKYEKDGKELFYLVKFDKEWLMFDIRNGTLENNKQDLIYLFFQYNSELFKELKQNFNIQYIKNTECVVMPYSSENMLKLIQLPSFKKIKLLIDLNGLYLYQRKFNKKED